MREGAHIDVAGAVAHALADAGVRHAFGLMGSGNLRIIHHLVHEHQIPFHNARHENAAVGMADGYARVTGDVGVCLVTQGPGLTNTVTALTTARRARTPLVLLAGDSSGIPGHRNPFSVVQSLDQAGLLTWADVPVRELGPGRAYVDVVAAMDHARCVDGPVAINMPVQHQTDAYYGPMELDVQRTQRPVPEPDPDQISHAAGLLERAARPLLLAGLGAVRAYAADAIRGLADRTGAILATSLRATGLFGEDPRAVGVAGGFSSPPVADVLSRADVVVAFGAALNNFTTKMGRLLGGKQILVHVDNDKSAIGRHTEVSHAIVGDARTVAERLVGQLPDVTQDPWVDIPSLLSQYSLIGDLLAELPDQGGNGWIDPRILCDRLDALLPSERMVITDGGHFSLFAVDHVSVPDPWALLYMLDFGATGGGLGAAVGAALGRPDRLAVLFIGDGGLMMTLGDLDIAVRDRIPVLIVVMNDEAYGSEVHQLRQAGLPENEAIFQTPDFVEVARTLGAEGRTVTDVSDLVDLPDTIRSIDGPFLLDCKVTRKVMSRLVASP